jgi:REP element-mobilizing transposase RayT
VSTDVNNREGVFQLPRAVRMLREVLHEARKIYEFEVCGLRVEDDRVSFYINAVDGVAVIRLNRGQPLKKKCSGFEKFEKNRFFCFFSCQIKAKRALNRVIYSVGKVFSQKHYEEVCI